MSFSEVLSGARRWHVERGNCLALLREMPDACVDAVVTDPPYSSGGFTRGDRMADPSTKYVRTGAKLERADFAGDNRDQRAYLAWCALWLAECLRVAKPGAPICVFTDWRQLPTTTDALQAGGWVWRGIVPWDKTEGCRPAMGRFAAQCEYVVWGSAGPMAEERSVGCLPGIVRAFPKPGEKRHLTGKTPATMMPIVRICEPGGVILDPFTGGARRASQRFARATASSAWRSRRRTTRPPRTGSPRKSGTSSRRRPGLGRAPCSRPQHDAPSSWHVYTHGARTKRMNAPACEFCAGTITAHPQARNQRFCSIDCRRKAPKGPALTCEACGHEFRRAKSLRPGRDKFCSARCYHDCGHLRRGFQEPSPVAGARWIELGGGRFTLVDADVFAEVGHLKWFLVAGGMYAARTIRVGKRTRMIYLHRQIVNAPPGSEVDHANENKLDNRCCNLRIADRGGNVTNKTIPPGRSGWRGVVPCWASQWEARVCAQGVLHRYGPFRTVEEAAKVYDDAARRLHGEFARPNFPLPGERGARQLPAQLPT